MIKKKERKIANICDGRSVCERRVSASGIVGSSLKKVAYLVEGKRAKLVINISSKEVSGDGHFNRCEKNPDRKR